jgi:glycosyltransferase involved in cell wall biosynthesis
MPNPSFFSRYFIIDPVCAQVRGHNLVSIQHFRNLLRDLTKGEAEILCFGSKELTVTAPNSTPTYINALLSFSYSDIQFLATETGQRHHPSLHPYPIPLKMPFTHYKDEYSQEEIRCITSHHQGVRDVANFEMKELLRKTSASKTDCIIFPSADIYSVLSIAKALTQQDPSKSPTIVFKFIHVMEYWSPLSEECLNLIFETVTKLLRHGHDIRICTESPGYSEYIKSTFLLKSEPLPLPIPPKIAEGLENLNTYSTVVLFPGTQRFDKGLARIPDIIASVNEHLGLDGAEFILQEPTHNDLEGSMQIYTEIMKYPNVTVFSSTLPDEKLRSLYMSAKCVCLPYDECTYDTFRSSGSYVEAASYCRPIAATECKGFAETLKQYKLGKLASNESDLATSIVEMLDWNIDKFLGHKAHTEKFFDYIKTSYSRIFSVNYNECHI